jgi:dihydroxyacetone kinase DhaKLM complex PTS-EIIA-like component DhaM
VKVIGIVVVSHSPLLDRGAGELASRMVIGESPKLAIAVASVPNEPS